MSPAVKKTWSGIIKISAVVLVVSLGIWGCARKPIENHSSNERIRSLEGKCVKLEQDFRIVAHARDRARKDLETAEKELSRLQRELPEREVLAKERDELREQLNAMATQRDQAEKTVAKRTEEREQVRRELNVKIAEFDTVTTRYDRLRKTLQTIVAQDDTCPQGVELPTAPTLGDSR
jgi:chromosome segregation ATPase